jgi:lauroyl/myristoyl acyltransferase
VAGDIEQNLVEDRPREAIAAIDEALRQTADDAVAFRLLMQKGRVHGELDELQSAADAFAAAVAIHSEDEAALDQLCSTLMAARRFDEAGDYQARLQAVMARSLPHSLAEGLGEIWRRTDTVDLDPSAVAWAWELADKSVWERDAWLASAAWGNAARRLLRRWWEAAPTAKLGELNDLIETPDLSELRAAMVERRGCIMVGAHVGPTAAAVDMFRRANWPFRTLGTADRDRAAGETMLPLITNSIGAMRAIVSEIKSGTTIGLLADTPLARDRVALEFLGRTIELPLQIPKLIQRFDIVSFWCCPLWHKGRIVLQLKQLPDPLTGEPLDAWCERWFAAYLAQLGAVMHAHPENLGLFSGIWGNVNPSVLRQRRKQSARIRRLRT